MLTPLRIDGRRLRSERTKQLITEAFLSLASEGSPRLPTAAEIARRAGCSIRSVFERFRDLQALQLAAIDHALVQAAALAPALETEGGRDARIAAQVERRAQSCESWLPLWRALLANRGDVPEFRQRIAAARTRNLARLELMFGPELSGVDEEERRQLLIVLEALTEVDSWARMRDHFGLSVADACAAWRRAIDRLLPATPVAATPVPA